MIKELLTAMFLKMKHLHAVPFLLRAFACIICQCFKSKHSMFRHLTLSPSRFLHDQQDVLQKQTAEQKDMHSRQSARTPLIITPASLCLFCLSVNNINRIIQDISSALLLVCFPVTIPWVSGVQLYQKHCFHVLHL